jgi:hypothetical protein
MEKIKFGQGYCYENFITEEEKNIIKIWALEVLPTLPNGTHAFRKMSFLSDLPTIPECIKDIKERIHSLEYDSSFHPEYNIDSLSIHLEGGNIPMHIDAPPNYQDYFKRRYNLFVSVAEEGGDLIYDDETLKIKERSLIVLEASLVSHGTTTVVGKTPRIMLSFSYAVKKLSTF